MRPVIWWQAWKQPTPKKDKLVIVGQGIDTNLFSLGSEKPNDPPIILCTGRLSPVKDHPTLLKAASILRARWQKPFRITIVGGRLAGQMNHISSCCTSKPKLSGSRTLPGSTRQFHMQNCRVGISAAQYT
jgi:hypothetical protein